MRAWAVGQATALAQGMRLLGTRAAQSWPEFAELECYQCHHDLRLESWRIQRGYAGRKPGSLQLNQARTEVVRVLVGQAAPEQKAALETALSQVASRVQDGAAVGQGAVRVAELAEALAARWEKQDFTAAQVRALIQGLVTDTGRLAGAGVNAAEVATMSLDSLAAAVSGNRSEERRVGKECRL